MLPTPEQQQGKRKLFVPSNSKANHRPVGSLHSHDRKSRTTVIVALPRFLWLGGWQKVPGSLHSHSHDSKSPRIPARLGPLLWLLRNSPLPFRPAARALLLIRPSNRSPLQFRPAARARLLIRP